mmetsp:Transcript_23148/g.71792  ORF Transcript_23148/g.71792 Transcript_23148/m.71792 type:complete len:218 (-) Transcript_23148:84-737(-)
MPARHSRRSDVGNARISSLTVSSGVANFTASVFRAAAALRVIGPSFSSSASSATGSTDRGTAASTADGVAAAAPFPLLATFRSAAASAGFFEAYLDLAPPVKIVGTSSSSSSPKAAAAPPAVARARCGIAALRKRVAAATVSVASDGVASTVAAMRIAVAAGDALACCRPTSARRVAALATALSSPVRRRAHAASIGASAVPKTASCSAAQRALKPA